MKALLEKFKSLSAKEQAEASKEIHLEAYFLKKQIQEKYKSLKK
jgi:hypothetical protein